MKKFHYKPISETDYLSSEQLDSIEMGDKSQCEPSCKKGCSPSNHDGSSTSKPAKEEKCGTNKDQIFLTL